MQPAPDTTRARLIEAAIRLFAERGVDGVSLRAAAEAAGARNTAAVHYHFKDREGLLQACLAHIVAALRRTEATPFPSSGDPLVDCLAEAFAPLMSLDAREPAWGEAAQLLLLRVLMGEGEGLGARFKAITEDDAIALADKIQPFVPHVSKKILLSRIDLAALMVLAALACRISGTAEMNAHPVDAGIDLLRFCAAGLRA
jgi:AcrR family transcriptional regulator